MGDHLGFFFSTNKNKPYEHPAKAAHLPDGI
jgi:hypothetical protein